MNQNLYSWNIGHISSGFYKFEIISRDKKSKIVNCQKMEMTGRIAQSVQRFIRIIL